MVETVDLSHLEIELLDDFLKFDPSFGIGETGIKTVLYDVVRRTNKAKVDGSRIGKAIHIGDGYFLTALHVVLPKPKKGRLELVPQNIIIQLLHPYNRLYIGAPFKLLDYDRSTHLALLKSPVADVKGKAIVHLSDKTPDIGQVVSTFFRMNGMPRQTTYVLPVEGVNYYDETNPMDLGTIVYDESSLMTQKQGRVLVYWKEFFSKLRNGALIKTEDVNFSSIVSCAGDSGSGVFSGLRERMYALNGIAIYAYKIPHNVRMPGKPWWFDEVEQTGTFFANRNAVERFIRGYISKRISYAPQHCHSLSQ